MSSQSKQKKFTAENNWFSEVLLSIAVWLMAGWTNPRRQRLWLVYPFLLLGVMGSGIVAAVKLAGREEMVLAQTNSFNSGSTGADGALEYTTPGTYVFNPRTLGLDPEEDNVFHFTTITIGAGVTVTLSGQDILGPVYWLASGAVQIDGVIDMSGEDGLPYTTSPTYRRPSIPGPGGYAGGVSIGGGSYAQNGLGPGGACAYNSTYSGGHSSSAGHANVGYGTSCGSGGAVYGNVFMLPLMGGSGGGGNGSASNSQWGGGGSGGGALLIASNISITVNGTVSANGGDSSSYTGPGAGSGGSIHFMTPLFNGTGLVYAMGGKYGPSSRTSNGRIRIDTFQNNFTGSSSHTIIFGIPYQVMLPENPPQVRVIEVNGIPVPHYPTGSYNQPDVTLDTTNAVTMTILANNVPVGSVVKLYVYSETSTDQIINSTPLAGTFMTSTTVITATIPVGPSRIFIRSDWTP